MTAIESNAKDESRVEGAPRARAVTTPGVPVKELPGLRWERRWNSHVGCVKACLDYLDADVSTPWLYGAAGYAFLLNVHEELCPSSWHVGDFAGEFFRLGENVGFTIDLLAGNHVEQKDRAAIQQRIWDETRKAIDANLPCYGYDLETGDYYVVYGYDDIGYYYSGPASDAGKGPLPWRDLGVTGHVGVLFMGVVKPGKAADDVNTVKAALSFALDYAKGGAEPNAAYTAGMGGYERWIRSLETGKAQGLGAAYNAQSYAESRRFAVEFLKEAKSRLAEGLAPLFDEAIGHYETVAQNLKTVADTFPFGEGMDERIQDPSRRDTAMAALKTARDAEQSGLAALARIVSEL